MNKRDYNLLLSLCTAFGPSGCEGEVAKIIEKEVTPYADEVTVDAIGNLTVLYRGRSSEKKLLLSAHMDEVGFMITEIDDLGLLRFSALGGIDGAVLLGKRILVGEKRVRGVISAAPFHLLEKDKRLDAPKSDGLYIDIGANDRSEAEAAVLLGDFAVFDTPFLRLGENKIKGKAIDDRAGAFALISVLSRLYKEGVRPDFDTVFAFTVREELGYSGALTLAEREKPDGAIVVETTAVADLASVPEYKRVAIQGEGAAISVLDRSSIYPRGLVGFALSVAKENGIKAQLKKFVSGGNDAAHIGKSGDGVPVLAISLPTRYLHSPACVVDTRDIDFMIDHIFKVITDKTAGGMPL